MWYLLAALIPSLLLADTAPKSAMTDLRLSPSLSAPVVLSIPASEITDAAPATTAEGYDWFTTERSITLEGYVAKADITKELEISPKAIVYSSPDKSTQLTVVENPDFARLLDVDKGLGRVRVNEPRVLYFAKTPAAAPVAAVEAPATIEVAPVAEDTTMASAPVVDETVFRGSAVATSSFDKHAIEGRLVEKRGITGKKLYLTDSSGNKIATVDAKSPVGVANLERYIGKSVVLVGEFKDKGQSLTLSVRSIRLR